MTNITYETEVYTDSFAKLRVPFNIRLVKFKPGNVYEGSCTPLAFVSWHEYIKRLHEDVSGAFSLEEPRIYYGSTRVSVSQAVYICGQKFSGCGDAPIDGDNGVCSAEDQALKRACAKAGLGLYLYDAKLPNVPLEGKKISVPNLVLAVQMYEEFGFEVPEEVREEAERASSQKRSYEPSGSSNDDSYLKNIKAKLKQYNNVPDQILDQLTTVDQAKEMQKRFMAKEDRETILANYSSTTSKPAAPTGYRRPWQN